MDVRLVQLMGSFIGARSEYILLRLEFAMRHPRHPAPPLIDRLPDASDTALREYWPRIETQLEAALIYLRRVGKDGKRKPDLSYTRMERNLREMEQYERAIRWVLTVTDRDGELGSS